MSNENLDKDDPNENEKYLLASRLQGWRMEETTGGRDGLSSTQPSSTTPGDIPTAILRARTQLVSLPVEIRDRIFRYVLPVGRVIQFELQVQFSNGDHGPSLHHEVECINRQEIFSEAINRLALLNTCKQAYREGRPILYRNNQWFANHVRPFKEFILPSPPPGTDLAGSGALFKDISLWVTRKDDVYPVMQFVCRNMPALRHFQITVSHKVAASHCPFHQPEIGEFLLMAASEFTRRHPILKKVIWNKKSGRSRHCVLTGQMFRYDQVETALTIDFVPVGSSSGATFQARDWTTAEDGDAFDDTTAWLPTNIVLDSLKIRNGPWMNVLMKALTQWALPETATSSELLDEQ